MASVAIDKYIPASLCLLFPDFDSNQLSVQSAVPLNVATPVYPRQLVMWHRQGFTNGQIIAARPAGAPLKGGQICMKRQRWHVANGIVATAEDKNLDKYVDAAVEQWEVDNFFFRRIGAIDTQAMTFTPPQDKAKNQAYLNGPAPAPQALPAPQDIPAAFRQVLDEYDYDVPTFAEWLDSEPSVKAHFFPHLSAAPMAPTTSTAPMAPAALAPSTAFHTGMHHFNPMQHPQVPPAVNHAQAAVTNVGAPPRPFLTSGTAAANFPIYGVRVKPQPDSEYDSDEDREGEEE